jgi:hypothetical protein
MNRPPCSTLASVSTAPTLAQPSLPTSNPSLVRCAASGSMLALQLPTRTPNSSLSAHGLVTHNVATSPSATAATSLQFLPLPRARLQLREVAAPHHLPRLLPLARPHTPALLPTSLSTARLSWLVVSWPSLASPCRRTATSWRVAGRSLLDGSTRRFRITISSMITAHGAGGSFISSVLRHWKGLLRVACHSWKDEADSNVMI